MERIVLASGCFWGAQDILRKIPGVTKTEVGYAGGHLDNPTYNHVKQGNTGHTEAVDVYFDPTEVDLEDILQIFFRMHDPTTSDRQGNDIGSQYRSAIFYTKPEQKTVVEKVIKDVESKNFWKNMIVTEVVPFKNYFTAEEYHQEYLMKHPGGYSCHFLRTF